MNCVRAGRLNKMDRTHELEFTRPVCRMANYISALGAIAVDVMVIVAPFARRLVERRGSQFTLYPDIGLAVQSLR